MPLTLLAKQYITAQLNVLSGASINPSLLAIWSNAGNALTVCCQGVNCDTSSFAVWEQALEGV
eukprot:GABW01004904.1.p1 GENE.GABW01004904.1~~GABW01004904.1.p1  ORF type:complete len:63 (+),score=12.37 GABW01004904.1:69-257(+)